MIMVEVIVGSHASHLHIALLQHFNFLKVLHISTRCYKNSLLDELLRLFGGIMWRASWETVMNSLFPIIL